MRSQPHRRRRSPFVRGAALVTAIAAGTAVGIGPATAAVPSRSAAGTTNVTATAAPATGSVAGRGTLLSSLAIRSSTSRQVRSELLDAGFDASAVRSGVTLYRLVYRTVDEDGRPATASGLLVLPHRPSHRALKVVTYEHGSLVFRGDAPSVTDDRWSTAAPVVFASAGFAALAPDYLGLGLGPGPHPWLDVPSEATASADLLVAARQFVQGTGRELDPDVLVTGFSQGASAALGFARALQNGDVPGFGLAAAAPISGAYDLRRTEIPALLNGRLDRRWSVAYLALLLVNWNRRYGLYDSPAEVFRSPYDRTLPVLLDGDHRGEEVLAGLPESVDALLTDHGRSLLRRHPTGALAAALRVADATCTGWTPQAPVRLYATRTDEQAAYGNSLACQAAFGRSGAVVPIVDVGDTDHVDSNARATAQIVRWFGSIGRRSPERG